MSSQLAIHRPCQNLRLERLLSNYVALHGMPSMIRSVLGPTVLAGQVPGWYWDRRSFTSPSDFACLDSFQLPGKGTQSASNSDSMLLHV